MNGSLESNQLPGNMENPLAGAQLSFIGCGVMAEAIIAGLLRQKLVTPEQIAGSHPRAARREELQAKYGIRMFEGNREAAIHQPSAENGEGVAHNHSTIVLAV